MSAGDYGLSDALRALPTNRETALGSQQRLRERMLMVSLRMCGERDQAAVVKCAAAFEQYVLEGRAGE